jgi:glycosyltransferase involved in cell wall biosynthesis
MDDAISLNSGETTRCPVSVIVPIYNSEGTLLRAIDSIARQSVLPCEVLLVDDFSIDRSIAVCEQAKITYRELFPVRIIRSDCNHGPSHARNMGWDVAKGKYVAFLDADDSWHPEKLRIQSDFMENHPEISLCGHLCGIYQANMLAGARIQTKILNAHSMLLNNPFSTPTVMAHNSSSHRFSKDMRYAEDYHLWLSMALDGLILARLECEMAVLYKQKYGEGGLSSNIWKMEKGELQMYYALFRKRRVSLFFLVFLISISIAKFLRRIVLLKCRRIS